MQLLQIRDALQRKSGDYDFARQELLKQNAVLHEYANSLLSNNLVSEITLKDGRVIAKLRTFPVLFNVPNKMGMFPIVSVTGKFDHHLYTMKMISMMHGKATIFDIGANIGYYSVIAGKLFPSAKVYSFEPISETFDELMSNIKINGLENIFPENLALTDAKTASLDSSQMFYSPEAPGAASFKNIQERDNIQSVNVKMETMDNYCSNSGVYPDFIKCDVEGSELQVLMGAEHVLKSKKPIIFIEILRKWCAKFGHTADDVVRFVKSCGYSMYVSRDEGLVPLASITDDTQDTNFIFM